MPGLPTARREVLGDARPRRRASSSATSQGEPMTLAIREKAPDFTLPDTEGREHSLPEGEVSAVVWTCNHCPYARAWHDRIVQVARDYAPRGARFLAVNSNDAERYPDDSLDSMRERVEAEDWPFPYLHDESQQAARAWSAQVTPHLY